MRPTRQLAFVLALLVSSWIATSILPSPSWATGPKCPRGTRRECRSKCTHRCLKRDKKGRCTKRARKKSCARPRCYCVPSPFD